MRERRRRLREMFVPLAPPPGHAQADFGEAVVIIAGVRRKAHFFVMDLLHSDQCFVKAYPAAASEAWLDGHNAGFAFFGGVPQSILYDNDKRLVARILPDGTRQRTQAFSGLQSHYLFEDRFDRPGKGNGEPAKAPSVRARRRRGKVEGVVGHARRNFMVPVPRFESWEVFNADLAKRCHERGKDVLRGHSESIGERFGRDQEALMALPPAPFDACDKQATRVSSLSLVRYRRNDYSVPVAYGHQEVWIRSYVHERRHHPQDRMALHHGGGEPSRPPDPDETKLAHELLPAPPLWRRWHARAYLVRRVGGRLWRRRRGSGISRPARRAPAPGRGA